MEGEGAAHRPVDPESVKTRWRELKHSTLRSYFLPIQCAGDHRARNSFRALNLIFEKQRREVGGAPGGAHVAFDSDVFQKLRMNVEDYTAHGSVRWYKWKKTLPGIYQDENFLEKMKYERNVSTKYLTRSQTTTRKLPLKELTPH